MKKNILLFMSFILIMASIYLFKNGLKMMDGWFEIIVSISIVAFCLGLFFLFKAFILSAQSEIIDYDLDKELVELSVSNELINNSLDKESVQESLEKKLESFFIEGKFEEFKSKAIENNIIDNNLKWTFSKNGQKYPVVLFHFLSERNIIKEISSIEIKSYCQISNSVFGINIDHTMYSKSFLKKIRELEFCKDYKEFLIFSEY